MEFRKKSFEKDEIFIREVSISPKLKVKEKKLLDKIFKKLFEGESLFRVSLGEFYNIYLERDLEKIKNELLKLSRKKFYIKFSRGTGEDYTGEFNIISSFYVGEKEVILFPPYEILNSVDRESIFYEMHFHSYTRFKERHSFKFFPHILRHVKNSYFDFSLDEMKEILEVEDNYYERFYDFEKNVLIPLMKDINKSTFLSIKYEKVKKGSGITSKIQYLRFHLIDEEGVRSVETTNEILNRIKDRVGNLSHMTHVIEEASKRYSVENLEKKIRWAEENFESPLDIFIEAALHSEYQSRGGVLKLLEVEEKFSSHFKIEGRIYKIMSAYNFKHNYHFLQELQNLRVKNKFNYIKNPWKITAEYNHRAKSRISIHLGTFEGSAD